MSPIKRVPSRLPDPPDVDMESIEALAAERNLTETHAVLWTVILVSAVFDILTTLVGLDLGLREGNAVARAFIDTYGTPGLGGLKFVALVALVLAWASLPDRPGTVVLAGFALVSLLVVAMNALTLASI